MANTRAPFPAPFPLSSSVCGSPTSIPQSYHFAWWLPLFPSSLWCHKHGHSSPFHQWLMGVATPSLDSWDNCQAHWLQFSEFHSWIKLQGPIGARNILFTAGTIPSHLFPVYYFLGSGTYILVWVPCWQMQRQRRGGCWLLVTNPLLIAQLVLHM